MRRERAEQRTESHQQGAIAPSLRGTAGSKIPLNAQLLWAFPFQVGCFVP